MALKKILVSIIFIGSVLHGFAQSCNCETEFTYVKNFMEANYAGFKDKKAAMTEKGYNQLVSEYATLSKDPNANEHCLMIIYQFLKQFKDHHVSIGIKFDAGKLDSAFISQKQIIPISDERIAELRKSTGFEGIYDFHEGTKYKIAVIKDKTPLHDYIGIIVSSNLPGWKPGMIKFEAKLETDSMGMGALFMQNGRPKIDGFYFWKNAISGDWHREGTTPEPPSYKYVPVESKRLSDKTLYIKISSFSPGNAKNIDSILRVNAEALKTMPNLVLDLRNNGGGADYTYEPLVPYIYSNPAKLIGVSVLATEANIKGWKQYLDDPDMSEGNKKSIRNTVTMLEAGKGKWVSTADDETISNYKKLASPARVVILIDRNCASTTEQFLLFARQSSKVILMGEHTAGTLDYSNVIQAPFSCMPYVLRYSSSRSRRLDKGEGIDNVGIKPKYELAKNSDWIAKAVAVLEH